MHNPEINIQTQDHFAFIRQFTDVWSNIKLKPQNKLKISASGFDGENGRYLNFRYVLAFFTIIFNRAVYWQESGDTRVAIQ